MIQCNATAPVIVRERVDKLIGVPSEFNDNGVLGMVIDLAEVQTTIIHELKSELEGKSDIAAEAIHQLNTEIERLNKVITVHREVGDDAENECLKLQSKIAKKQTGACCSELTELEDVVAEIGTACGEHQKDINWLKVELNRRMTAANEVLRKQQLKLEQHERINTDTVRRLNELNTGLHKLQLTVTENKRHEHAIVQCSTCAKLVLCPSCKNVVKAI